MRVNLIVFGATGLVGKQLTEQALYMGHHVRAFGRNVFTTDYLQTDNLHRVQGALFDAHEVYDAIRGCDAVLSAIGGGQDGTDKSRTLGMKNILTQMQKAGVKRIIAIGDECVLENAEGKMLLDEEDYPREKMPLALEHKKAYELLTGSSLNWTFVCPARIIDRGPTGHYTTAADHQPGSGVHSINSGDLALFMLNELTKNEYIERRVGISN